MWRLYALVAAVWIALSPPFFTQGACTAEFDAIEPQIVKNLRELRSPESAAAQFRADGWPTSVLTPERCREAKPRFIDRCGGSTYVVAKAPIENKICAVYRDSEVRVLLEYADKGQLVRMNTEMAPFKSLRIPVTDHVIHWGR